MTLREEFTKAKKEAKQSGKRIQKVFDKKEFSKAYPQFASDPRTAFTPDVFIMDVTPMEAITVSELCKLCQECGSDFAMEKASQVSGLVDTQIVYVLRQDLDKLKGQVIEADASGEVKPKKPAKPPKEPQTKLKFEDE